MRIVICVKEVLDPDAVNAYAVAGRLTISADGRTLTSAGVPSLMNAYDEQAIEAALRLRDAGVECSIAVVTAAPESSSHLRRAAALGADDLALIPVEPASLDAMSSAALLAAWITANGGADLVLCGRQASDDDQGAVPAILAERLGMPVITMARAIQIEGDGDARRVVVTRVTPDGDEVVSCALPAVVTVSSELGTPRFPTAAATMAARRKKPVVVPPASLDLDPDALAPRVTLRWLFVPAVQGNCEFIEGGSPRVQAAALLERLRGDGLLPV
jgi:electron transfer flavoprotein beta subunit